MALRDFNVYFLTTLKGTGTKCGAYIHDSGYLRSLSVSDSDGDREKLNTAVGARRAGG